MDRKNSVQEYPWATRAALWLLRHQDKVKETLLRVCAQTHDTNYIDWKSIPFPARQNPLGKSDFTVGESRFYDQPNRTVCIESSEGLMKASRLEIYLQTSTITTLLLFVCQSRTTGGKLKHDDNTPRLSKAPSPPLSTPSRSRRAFRRGTSCYPANRSCPSRSP
jgi:hypothetical protein